MCCRCYVDYQAINELRRIYDELKNKENIKLSGEIYPTDHLAVLSLNKNKEIRVFNMKWGYSVNNISIFNARSESLESTMFKDGIKNRRCVIPVINYYEWEKNTKIKYEIKSKDSVTYLLGVYRIENSIPVFSILTKDASDNIKFIHDRMPVIIDKENIIKWISDPSLSYYFINNSITDLDYKVSME